MTENEAKKLIAKFCEDRMNFARGKDMSDKELEDFCKFSDALTLCISSLEEIQQYRAIGTVEECREARERQRVKDIIHNPDGGVDEDWLCPSCGRFCSPYTKHCQHCGQAVKVGDNL